MDRYEDYEPVTRVDEGWFVDDYYVDYEKVNYYKISDSSLEELESNFAPKAHDILDDQIKIILDHLDEYHNSLIDSFINDCIEHFENNTQLHFHSRSIVYNEDVDFSSIFNSIELIC